MFRYDSETGVFYRKFYGNPNETEIPHDDKLLVDAQSGNNRVISEQCYRLERRFDKKFPGNRQTILVDTDAQASELFDYLGIKWQTTSIPERLQAKANQGSLTISIMPLPESQAKRAPVSFGARVLNVTFHDRDEGLVNDPDTYQFELDIVVKLMNWDRATQGIYEMRSRPTVQWRKDQTIVTTDPDLLSSTPGSILLSTLDGLNVNYRHVERTN